MYSEPYEVRQGVKQGVLSPSLYILYICDLLRSFRSAGLGVHIGHLCLGTPSCADDVLLLSNLPSEMQAMLNVNSVYSKSHKYEIHPTKSTVTPLYQPKSKQTSQEEWNLAGNSIPIESQLTHLGLEWKAGTARPNISKCYCSQKDSILTPRRWTTRQERLRPYDLNARYHTICGSAAAAWSRGHCTSEIWH